MNTHTHVHTLVNHVYMYNLYMMMHGEGQVVFIPNYHQWSWMGKGVRLWESGVKGNSHCLFFLFLYYLTWGLGGTGTDFIFFFSQKQRYSHIKRN